MDVAQLTALIDELSYLRAKISKYQKKNRYVYLRAFDSWLESYNTLAAQLECGKTLRIPSFKLKPSDYSPTGKSIQPASVEKFIKTINHQVIRLADKIEELHKTAAQTEIGVRNLADFFAHNPDGFVVEPALIETRAFVAMPAGEVALELFRRGIQPVLESRGFSFFRADYSCLDDGALSELCQELQASRLAIFNLSGPAPHVMLALGLAYGIGKPVIILQPQDDTPLGELSNCGYLRYATASDIKKALGAIFVSLLKN